MPQQPDVPVPLLKRSVLGIPSIPVTLDNNSNAYPAGLHAGDALGLSNLFPNLVAGNIKSGVKLFGVDGSIIIGEDTTPGTAGVGDVVSGKKFYSGMAGQLTGTRVSEITTGDTAVVGDVASGKLFHSNNAGQLTGTLKWFKSQSAGSAGKNSPTASINTDASATLFKKDITINATTELELITTTHNIADPDQAVMYVVTALLGQVETGGSQFKGRLYIDSSQVNTDTLTINWNGAPSQLLCSWPVFTSGNHTVSFRVYNPNGTSRTCRIYGGGTNGSYAGLAIWVLPIYPT